MSKNIVLFSGGKDSLALALFLKQKREDFKLVYNSYGYEPSFYWDYLDYVSKKLGLELDITYPVKDFLEVFKLAPTSNVPQCRHYVKIEPLRLYLKRNKEVGKVFVGIRSDEKRGCPRNRNCPMIDYGITLKGG